jgi:predicted RNA binding protein YcfA (HicA-like mRNA interferase family)
VREELCRSHMILRHEDPFAQVVAPDYPELDLRTLRAIMRQAGLTVDQFKDFLK